MGRSVMLSNGELMVGLNENGLVHDFYFPYVGQENLTNARSLQHMVGVWVDEKFSWIDDGSWQIVCDFEPDALISKISARSELLELRLEFSDFVDTEHNAFCRRITVFNMAKTEREVRIFLHQVFQISHRGRADTALFVPDKNYIYDYKGRCALLIHAVTSAQKVFDQFSIGNFGIEDKEGTFRDAEDGILDGNLVEHGSVDTVVRCSLQIPADGSDYVDYWIVAAYSQFEAEKIHLQIQHQGLHARLDHTREHWRDWLSAADRKIQHIDQKYQTMVKKSALIIKAHVDKRGAIIASGDSSIYNYGRDYYSYVWPRDGALTMLSLMRLGLFEEAEQFFYFCADTIHPDGYMMHKYQPDRSIGSTWHPLMHRHHPELAIQEDETASVVFAVAEYYRYTKNEQFINNMYARLVRPAANFMARFIDEQTNLPHASYDLWEEKFGTHTYTVAVTKAALDSAAVVAEALGHQDSAKQWQGAAQRLESNFNQLYSEKIEAFIKGQLLDADGQVEKDETIDISNFYGILKYLPSKHSDKEFSRSVDTMIQKLSNTTPSGGVVRYEHDAYFLEHKEYIGNPWIVCSFWMAQYFSKVGDRTKAFELVEWCLSTATASGMLAEQIDPVNKAQIGVSPLVWSHAEAINTLLDLYDEANDGV